MKKRITIFFCSVFMIGLLITGCGSAGTTIDNTSDAAPGTAVEATSETDPVDTEQEVQDVDEPEQGIQSTGDADAKEEMPTGTEISINADTQRKMNIFLSNFSEAGLYEYNKDHQDLRDIVQWAYLWTKINKRENISYEQRSEEGLYSSCERIRLDDLNSVIDRYLGFTISDEQAVTAFSEPDKTYLFFYENGYFYAPAADGEAYTYLSVVSKAEDLDDSRLKLYFNVFSQDLDAYFDGKDKDYSLTYEEATDDPEYEKLDAGYAIVRDDGSAYKLEQLVRN